MSNNQSTVKNRGILLSLLAIFAASGLFAWWTAARVDREIRANLLQQTRLLVQTVDVDHIKALTGTEADIHSPYYQRLKEQLAAARAVNPKCRFVYLMGRKADNTVFFFVDSEIAGTKDYSPPGQIYEEVPAGYRHVFDAKTADVVGPVTDRWGVWVSALAPITDQTRGAVVGVLGVDINARSWRWDIAMRTILPAGLMLMLLLLGFIYILLRRTYGGIRAQQTALRESELKFRTLFDSADDAIFLIKDNVVFDCNHKTLNMFCCVKEDIIGHSPMKFSPEIQPDGLLSSGKATAKMNMALESAPQFFEWKHRRTNGVLFDTEVSLNRIEIADITYVQAIVRDITERKRSEEVLWASKLQLSQAMDLANIVYWELDPTDNMFIFNDSFYDFYGTTAEKEGGYRMTREEYTKRFIHPDDLPRMAQLVEQNITEFDPESIADFEHRIIRRDGVVRHIVVRAIASKDDSGHLIKSYGANQDITERKKIERTLKESESKFRNIFENAVMGIFQTTPEGRVLNANPALARICGYDSSREMIDALTDISTQLYVHPEDRIRLKGFFQKHGFVERFETQFYRKDGSIVWVSMNARSVTDAEGNIALYEGILEDFTVRKQAEEELRATHQRLSAIIEFLPDATFVIDEKKKVVAWNRACEEMTGVRKEEIIGKGNYAYAVPFYGEQRPILIDYVTMDSDELRQNYTSIRKTGHRLYAETFIPKLNNGNSAYLSANASALFDGTGNVVGAIESVRDVTEFKHLESQLLHSQKMEAIGTLAGGIAHDFNNILTALMGYAALIQMEMSESDPMRAYVDEILVASQKAADLTQSLLTFSRQKTVELVPLDINNAIRMTEKLLRRLVTEDIELRISLTQDDAIIMADETQIDQVLFNLVTNARDAMPKGGILAIETAVVIMDNDFIKVHGFGEQGEHVLMNVSDTGTGIDKRTCEKIFDPFFTTKEVGKGTGLGLATVYGIVKQHRGHITVESEPNQGTTFSIYFPVTRSKVNEEQDTTTPIITGNETLLIAEDNAEVRHFIQKALQEHGYTIIEAIDGEDAVDKFKQNRHIDLIVLDSVMPKKNGREVYEEIRMIVPHVKVLFTSGYTKDIVLDKGVKDGEFDFIAKPLSLGELLGKIRLVLDRQ